MTSYGINWNLLPDPSVIAQGIQQGFKEGRTRGAMNALAANPDDPRAMGALLQVDPKAAYAFQEQRRSQVKAQRDEATFQREQAGRNALSEWLTGGYPAPNALAPSQSPLPTGVTPAPGIGAGSSPQPAPVEVSRAPKADFSNPAFRNLVALDHETAFKIADGLGRMDKAGREAAAYKNDVAGSAAMHLQSFGDPASRRQELERIAPQLIEAGIRPEELQNLDVSDAGLQGRVALSMDVKEIFAQQDREADNARADREAESRDTDRTERRGLVVRGQNLADTRGRRGQDLTSDDRRRGQDMTDRRIREGFGGGGRRQTGRRVAPGPNVPAGSPLTPPAGAGRIIRNPKTGERMQLQGGKWVPIR